MCMQTFQDRTNQARKQSQLSTLYQQNELCSLSNGFHSFSSNVIMKGRVEKGRNFYRILSRYHILHRLLNIKIIDFCIIEYSRPPRLKGKDCTKRASYLSRNILYIKSITISQTSKPAFLRIRNFFIFSPRDKRLIHQYYIIMINKNENCCPIC